MVTGRSPNKFVESSVCKLRHSVVIVLLGGVGGCASTSELVDSCRRSTARCHYTKLCGVP